MSIKTKLIPMMNCAEIQALLRSELRQEREQPGIPHVS